MSSFGGKTAIVTGAAGGIGRAVSLLLARRGASLTLVDMDASRLAAVATEVGKHGAVATVAGDASDPDVVDQVFRAAYKRFGGVDVLASNAAVIRMESLADTSVEDYETLMRSNARSGFLFLRGFARSCLESGRPGSVVVTSSVAGLKGSPGLVAYSMSKQALAGLTRSAAVELAPSGIRVNAVAPGRVNTGLLHVLADKGGPEAGLDGVPIPRAADPGEIANLMVWLLSDEASFVTGMIYSIDGGRTA
jgi:3alpha(or 20beta)-hydroxysteroid dehydrogenase